MSPLLVIDVLLKIAVSVPEGLPQGPLPPAGSVIVPQIFGGLSWGLARLFGSLAARLGRARVEL